MPTLAVIVEQDTLSVHEKRMLDIIGEAWEVTLFQATHEDLVELRDPGWFYRFYLAIESWFIGLFVSRIRRGRQRVSARIESISSAPDTPFDLVLSLARGALRADRTPPSKRGVLVIHYGNFKDGVEGPPAFWESCHGTSTTGWWLTHARNPPTASAAGPTSTTPDQIVFSRRYKTKRFLSMNVESVLRESHIDLGHELNRLAGDAAFRDVALSANPTWLRPDIGDVVRYRLTTLWRELTFFLKTKAVGKQMVFSVAFAEGHWQEADLAGATVFPNPKGSYLADPFLVERDGRTVCYVEEFDLASERGRISWIDLGDGDGPPEYRGTLIEEPYHMSFPFPFEYDGELYMVPETFEAGEISLYRCVEFPGRWERCGTLIEDVEASDSMIFEHEGRWWMLTNLRPEGALDFYSRLYVFWSDDPTSSHWTPHPLNPVLVDSDGGRNGGLLLDASGLRYRVGQEQGVTTYGVGRSGFQIQTLDDQRYHEGIPIDMGIDALDHTASGHHVHGIANQTTLDLLRRH